MTNGNEKINIHMPIYGVHSHRVLTIGNAPTFLSTNMSLQSHCSPIVEQN